MKRCAAALEFEALAGGSWPPAMSKPTVFPWIAIPRYPQQGPPYAFADREDHVAELYKSADAAAI